MLIAAMSVSFAASVEKSTSLQSLRAARRRLITKKFTITHVKVWRRVNNSKRHARPVTFASKTNNPSHMGHVRDEQITDDSGAYHLSGLSMKTYTRKRSGKSNSKVMEQRVDSDFHDNATLDKLPAQPVGKLRMQLSIILLNSNVTDLVNAATIACHVNRTNTNTKDWGIYSADRFTNELAQVEFFAMLAEDEAQKFASIVDRFIQGGNLTSCLRNAHVGFSSKAEAFAGRVVTAPGAASVSQGGGAPAWVVAIIIGIAAMVGIVVLVVAAFRPDDNKKSDHESLDDDEVRNGAAGDTDAGEQVWMVDEEELEIALQQIAGLDHTSYVSAAPR